MANAPSVAIAADMHPLPLKITGRALNTLSVVFLSMMVAIFTSASALTTTQRTGTGLLLAALMVIGGDVASRRGSRAWWFGTSLMVSGYALAYFFAHASYYIRGLSALGDPYPCWLLELALVAAATWHCRANSLLRWFALPFALLVSVPMLLNALNSTDLSVTLLGWQVSVPALASAVGMVWWSALSACYKHFEVVAERDGEVGAVRLFYRVGHELYFVLAAINALALPQYWASMDYAPLWWSVEMPMLLAVCWRSGNFIKHGLIMAVWAVSAGLVLLNDSGLHPAVNMAVPAAGLAMALAYRLLDNNWARWQKLTGYAVYLYGSGVVALAVPFIKMGAHEAVPYWLVETGVLLGLGLWLKDRLLVRVGCLVGMASLALYGTQWRDWNMVLTATAAFGCYGFAIVFGYFAKHGGLLQSDFAALPGKYTLSPKEADWLEMGASVCGYLGLMSGSYLLLSDPFNTIAWAVIAFSLIVLGLTTDKILHRFCGLVAMVAASAKMYVIDMSGASTGYRTLAAIGALFVCCFAAGRLYLAMYERYQRANNQPPPSDGDSGDADR